jgi:hypothetical protein
LQLKGDVFGGVSLRNEHRDLEFTTGEATCNLIRGRIRLGAALIFYLSDDKNLAGQFKATNLIRKLFARQV